MADLKKDFTSEGKPNAEQDYDPNYIQAKKTEFAAQRRDSGNQHKMPLVVKVNGQLVYTQENY